MTLSIFHCSPLKSVAFGFLLAVVGVAQAQSSQQATPQSSTEAREYTGARPFKDVVRDADELAGFFTLYRREEKVWISIRPEQLNRPFFFSYNIRDSVGERGLYAGQMGGSHIVMFRKIGGQVQLVAQNVAFTAQSKTPQALAVAQGFSDSLLATAPVVGAPNPENKAILIDAAALLFNDIPSYSTRLDLAYRMPFSIDPRNSYFMSARADERIASFYLNAHFAVTRLAAPPLTPQPVPLPSPPTTTPDPRSLFVGFYYNMAALPAELMPARVADDRIGHFVTTSFDYTDDSLPKTARYYVNRWRLEKQDLEAELSLPKQPITFWLDRNIPEKYRQSITDGVLEWNKAFERIGFKNAIEVKQQGRDDEFDTLDARHASIRWFVGTDVSFAIGPSQVDPRTGEILDADVGISDVFARNARRFMIEDYGRPNAFDGVQPTSAHPHQYCEFAHEANQEMGFAFDLLDARNDFEMDPAKSEQLVQAYLKAVVMHEVGHALGLRHNFRSSTIYELKQLQNAAFTKVHGMTGSVMDYIPFNLAVKGETQGEYVMSTLGPYDYWAIEYAYKSLDKDSEQEELAKIAALSTKNELTFGTDEDAEGNVSDPEISVFDLGGDPLEYFKKRLMITRELWDRLQSKQLKEGESYETLRRSFDSGFRQFSRSMPLAAKYIGGLTVLRDHAGTGRVPFTPVPVQRQKEALSLITENLFKTDSFKFPPDLVSRLGIDHFERRAGAERYRRPDISISGRILGLQRSALDHLMADSVAIRLLDAQEKVADRKQLFTLSMLYDTLQTSIWTELKEGKDITGMRRNLQREHIDRIATMLVRPGLYTPADARSLQRANAIVLRDDIRFALRRTLSKETRAHLEECLNTLDEALKARLQRNAV